MMSRREERKRYGEVLNELRRLYAIAGVASFLAAILFMRIGHAWTFAAASCCLGVVALCGPVLAYFVEKYEKREARYNGPREKDPFEDLGEKSLIEQAKNLIAWVRKRSAKEGGQ